MLNTTQEQMKEEILTELGKDYTDLDRIRDNAGKWIDGYLPVYNNQIIDEWKAMPREYDDRGGVELGHMGETTIVGLMSLDLYLYYSDLFHEMLGELEAELEGAK